MKTCSVCRNSLPTSQFFKDRTKSDGLCQKCKTCAGEYKRQYRGTFIGKMKHKLEMAQRVRRNVESRNEAKATLGCVICGYSRLASALDYHHVCGEKEFNISEMRTKGVESTSAEIAKCVLVCANCHREIHAGLHPEYMQESRSDDYGSDKPEQLRMF